MISSRFYSVSRLTNNAVSPDVRKAIAAHRGDDARQIYSHVDVEVMRMSIEGAMPELF
jgi:hypothetical protein